MCLSLTFRPREVRTHLAHRRDDIVDIFGRHAVEHRKANKLLGCELSLGVIAIAKTEPAAVVGMLVNRRIVHIHAEPFGSKCLPHIITDQRRPDSAFG